MRKHSEKKKKKLGNRHRWQPKIRRRLQVKTSHTSDRKLAVAKRAGKLFKLRQFASNTEAAMAALSDSPSPNLGIVRSESASSSIEGLTPLASFPTTNSDFSGQTKSPSSAARASKLATIIRKPDACNSSNRLSNEGHSAIGKWGIFLNIRMIPAW